MHACPRCGQQTEGAFSEGGLRWAICENCMEKDRKHDPVVETAAKDKKEIERLKSELRFVRDDKNEEFERAALAEAKLDRIKELLRGNMQFLIPDWDFDNPDIVAGVSAELSSMQAEMIQANVRADEYATKLNEAVALLRQLIRPLQLLDTSGESVEVHYATDSACQAAEWLAAHDAERLADTKD